MKYHRNISFVRGVTGLCVIATFSVAIPASLAGASQTTTSINPSPYVINCPTSGQDYEIANHSITAEGVGTIFEQHNVGKIPTGFGLTKTISGSYTGTVTGTGSGNIDYLIGSIGASLSVSLEITHSESISSSNSVQVPPGDYGIIQETENIVTTVGTLGDYEGGSVGSNGLCSLANAQTVSTSYPESNYVSYNITGTATSSTAPWPQA